MKSFRVQIIVYSFLSLLYTIITELVFFGIFYSAKTLFQDAAHSGEKVGDGTQRLPDISNNVYFNPGNENLNYYNQKTSGIFTNSLYLYIIIAIVIGALLFVLFFLVMTRKFTIYLKEIISGINEISLGNFEAKIMVNSNDEFALMADQINNMSRKINLLIKEERKAEEAKNELITSVAHDLRTPLTSIIGYLYLVSVNKNLEAEKKDKYIEIAYDKSKRLENLIEDLFRYTKYSSGEVKLYKEKINIVKFMEQMIEEFYPSVQEAELELEFYSNVKEGFIFADGERLARAIGNLMVNAIKYGRDGKVIRIKLEILEGNIKIAIVNYGAVIPKKDLDNIFDRFYRVDNSRSRETGGSGLGLTIAKRIITMHDGSIAVKSDFDGTEFNVVFKEYVAKEEEQAT
ncbi:sensor histidine kinase [Anaeromicropila populeti]|uniref:sensor histidine kinase n=1 Tax=Anaeromicropila populeti TaxID=37658 RepID=UPI001A9A4387|nr:HAMP domain-containing sensor histidine kinase [Anaeromicropila populeti]